MNPVVPAIILIFIILIVLKNRTPETSHTLFEDLFSGNRKILETYFVYFNQLTEKEKNEFLRRTKEIANTKFFVPKDNFLVTKTMKTLISGALAQLTFGMKNYILPAYRTIYIYPEAFENHRTGKMHRGETNTNGYISLSWKHFMFGFKIPNDRLNVGLHEMAHALLNTIIFSELHDPKLDDKLILLDKIPESEREGLFSGENPFFRNYALTNIKEFFAVSIEGFFESPVEFEQRYPVYYKYLSNLLNQDPAQGKFQGLT